jgi:mycofactocin precursor
MAQWTDDQPDLHAGQHDPYAAEPEPLAEEALVEEVSIDGMCGVY